MQQSVMKPLRIKILGLILLFGGLALCGVGLWLLLSPAEYAATAITSELTEVNDSGGGPGFQVNPPVGYRYDPYRVQTTFEIIQSPAVLSNAVVKLNLNYTWNGNTEKSSPVDFRKTTKSIKSKLKLIPVRGNRPSNSIPEGLYMGIAISVTDVNASKAAAIANAVAEAYCDYRNNTRRELIEKGFQILHQQYQDEEKQLSLHPTNREQLLEEHKLLGKKIEEEKMAFEATKAWIVQTVDRAEPPSALVNPNRSLGAVLSVAGLLSLLGGILLLKSSRNPAV